HRVIAHRLPTLHRRVFYRVRIDRREVRVIVHGLQKPAEGVHSSRTRRDLQSYFSRVNALNGRWVYAPRETAGRGQFRDPYVPTARELRRAIAPKAKRKRKTRNKEWRRRLDVSRFERVAAKGSWPDRPTIAHRSACVRCLVCPNVRRTPPFLTVRSSELSWT